MKKIKSLKLFVFIKCLLLLGLMLTCKNEEDINLRTVAENAFFTYSGTAPAISEITLGLKDLNEQKNFSSAFIANYGQPVWQESIVVTIDKEETIIITPIKLGQQKQINTLWVFFAHNNIVSNIVLTKEMLSKTKMDLEWGFDYFNQKMFSEEMNYQYHFHELSDDLQTRSGVLVTYCVNYTIEIEFEGKKATSSGTHCWNEYYRTHEFEIIDHVDSPANVVVDDIYVSNQQAWGGGGGDTHPMGNTPTERFNRTCKIVTEVRDQERDRIISVVDKFATTPVFERLYFLLSRKTLYIKMDPMIGVNAQYDKSTNTISYRTETDILNIYFDEELIHAAQAIEYGDRMLNKYKNFEFEAKVLRDLVAHRAEGGAFIGSFNMDDQFMGQYQDFILDMCDRKSISDIDIQLYFDFLERWTGYPGIVDKSILPQLLIAYSVLF